MIFKPLTDPYEWQWAKERIRLICSEDSQGIVAWRDGEIQAVCVADVFTPDACNVHFAIANPFVIRHGFFNEIARHLYEVCGRERLFGYVPANNEKALRLDKHIGFKEVARIPDGLMDGIDLVVLRMDKDECRWLSTRQEAA